MTYYEQLLGKLVGDSNTSFLDEYPSDLYDIYIIGPCCMKNNESLVRYTKYGDPEEIKFNIDEEKQLISYVEYTTKQSVVVHYEDEYKCWLRTGDMLCQAHVFTCRKKDVSILSCFSTKELVDELLLRLTYKRDREGT